MHIFHGKQIGCLVLFDIGCVHVVVNYQAVNLDSATIPARNRKRTCNQKPTSVLATPNPISKCKESVFAKV
eukprot:3327324-Amphidinium_carterae.2